MQHLFGRAAGPGGDDVERDEFRQLDLFDGLVADRPAPGPLLLRQFGILAVVFLDLHGVDGRD